VATLLTELLQKIGEKSEIVPKTIDQNALDRISQIYTQAERLASIAQSKENNELSNHTKELNAICIKVNPHLATTTSKRSSYGGGAKVKLAELGMSQQIRFVMGSLTSRIYFKMNKLKYKFNTITQKFEK